MITKGYGGKIIDVAEFMSKEALFNDDVCLNFMWKNLFVNPLFYSI